jgi:MFS family permease
MQVVAPDLLVEARELSLTVCATGLGLGLLLWLFGWRLHRFWIVLTATLAGGVAGLGASPTYGVQPLVAGLLAAVAAGVLALALVRVVAFAGGALAGFMLVRAVAPGWDQPLVSALVGGLLGVFLFRLWMMLLTSLLGTVLGAYAALCLLDQFRVLDAPSWSEQQTVLLNWLTGTLSVLGLLVQFLLERRQANKQRQREQAAKQKKAEEEEKAKEKKSKAPPPKTSWWPWGLAADARRAG